MNSYNLSFHPFWYQEKVIEKLSEGYKRIVLLWARRSGKDLLGLNIALIQCLKEPCTVLYIFPTHRQARDVIWNSLTIDGRSFLSYIPDFAIEKKNDTRLEVHFKNGSILALRGSNNADSLRGLSFKMALFSEYADHDPICWQQVVQPVLRHSGGTALFLSTPKGFNHFFQLCELAKNDDRWYFDKKTIEDTGHMNQAEIELDIERGQISREVAMQEYHCSFERGHQGLVFGGEMHKMRMEDRIGYVPYEDGHSVYTAWDLGWDDETCILWFQLIGQSLRVIDYYANRQQNLAHYAQVIHSKPYTYGKHFFPHDAKQANLQTGTTRLDTLYDLGIKAEVVPMKRVVDRLENGRQAFAKAWIDDKKCAGLIKSLDAYHREWNETLGKYNEMPVHDFSSHACFVGNTLVLTKHGLRPIMDINDHEQVLTLSGWSECTKAVKTKIYASVVEITFQDGTKVKCTPEHLFLTDNGWRSAESLTNSIKIQSSLTASLITLMELYIDVGHAKDIGRVEDLIYIEMSGDLLLEKFQKIATYIISTLIPLTTIYGISSVCQKMSTIDLVNLIIKEYQISVEKLQLHGINQKQENCGIIDRLLILGVGSEDRRNQQIVNGAAQALKDILEKILLDESFVKKAANPLLIENVKKITELEDVYDISVPGFRQFSLANGAIVHNSDAWCYLAVAFKEGYISKGMTQESVNELKRKARGSMDPFDMPQFKNPSIW